jgi:hypothetical protein
MIAGHGAGLWKGAGGQDTQATSPEDGGMPQAGGLAHDADMATGQEGERR